MARSSMAIQGSSGTPCMAAGSLLNSVPTPPGRIHISRYPAPRTRQGHGSFVPGMRTTCSRTSPDSASPATRSRSQRTTSVGQAAARARTLESTCWCSIPHRSSRPRHRSSPSSRADRTTFRCARPSAGRRARRFQGWSGSNPGRISWTSATCRSPGASRQTPCPCLRRPRT